ncbi:hypothetical protein ACPV5O_26815 [Vibrio maritimus]|uniref:hypothetical protein n=1 Tax=Vibrio maritimus TaxID=990268 RepID=UPI00406979F4
MAEHNNDALFETKPWKLRVKERVKPPKQPSQELRRKAETKRRIETILEDIELRKQWELDYDDTKEAR